MLTPCWREACNGAGDRLRITAQLVDAGNGFHFWSERFARQMTDVFAIQDEITLAIVKQLKVELLAKERSALLTQKNENLESYNLYLKGRYYWAQRPTRHWQGHRVLPAGDHHRAKLRPCPCRIGRLLRHAGLVGERYHAANRGHGKGEGSGHQGAGTG